MNANEKLIQQFYTAFQKHDGDGMAACYAPDVQFSDPVFPDLRGDRAAAMWRSFCSRGKEVDLRIDFSEVSADEARGRARWIARYRFGARQVVNDIQARFEFRDGKIAKHQDTFGFWKWARQALGPLGLLLGWTPFVHAKVRRMAAARLEDFIAKK